ncbi:MAG: hypothetical protein JRK53_00645 [Deltaproteobacteria bacterium]|nr:hypothetical protein [Deltaproteobacteria bacterium]
MTCTHPPWKGIFSWALYLREAFGQPIGQFQHNTFKLVEMATEIELGRTFVGDLLADHIEGKEIIKKVSMAKWWLAEMANRVAAQCVQLHGGLQNTVFQNSSIAGDLNKRFAICCDAVYRTYATY